MNTETTATTTASTNSNPTFATKPLYLVLADLLERKERAQRLELPELLSLVDDELTRFQNCFLPSGSGFDSGSVILARSSVRKICIQVDFHHMVEGFYTKWTHHTVEVTPGWGGFNLKVTGPNHRDIVSYISEVFHTALLEEVPTPVQKFIDYHANARRAAQ